MLDHCALCTVGTACTCASGYWGCDDSFFAAQAAVALSWRCLVLQRRLRQLGARMAQGLLLMELWQEATVVRNSAATETLLCYADCCAVLVAVFAREH